MRIYKICALACLLLLATVTTYVHGAALGRNRHDSPSQRSLSFRNNSGRRVDVLWVNVHKRPNEFISQNGGEGYPYGGDTNILSYIGHEFEVREMPGKKSGKCVFDECRTARFKVNDQENQVYILERSFTITHEDDLQQAYALAQDLFDECQELVEQKDEEIAGSFILSPLESVEALTKCMEQRVNDTLAIKQEERDFQSTLRRQMAQDLIPYACGDVNYTESQEVQNLTWHYREIDQVVRTNYQIKLLHERPGSEIVTIEGFASIDQCKAIEAYLENGKVPFRSITERTTQGIALHELSQKLYTLLRSRLRWENLEFTDTDELGHPLFEAHIDESPVDAPALICVGDDFEEDRKAGKCRLFGDKPMIAETKPIVVEKDSQLAHVFLFCEEPVTLGALHFPFAGTHISPKAGKLVIAINRRLGDEDFDGYVNEYHLCPNHAVYIHTIEEPAEADESE